MSFSERLTNHLAERKNNQLLRSRKILSSGQAHTVHLQNRPETLLNFCSNDYLGLAQHPEIISSFQKAAALYGVGSGASHLVIGHHLEHHLLEQELAEFLNVERTLVFGSGYAANLGVLTTLLEKSDAVFQDKLNHASLLDGGLFSGALFQRYLHKDMHSLEKKLAKASVNTVNIKDTQQKLIVSDAVFSMDGDSADIGGLLALSKKYQAWLMLDDAHGFGVLGKEGRGSVSQQNIAQQEIDIYMATFGKALGCGGAFVAGSDLLIESLIQFSRHYIYTTAMPPALAAAIRTALKIVKQEQWRRDHLQKLIKQFREGAQAINLNLLDSSTAIQPVILGSAQSALAWSEALLKKDILISAIRPPTVPANSSRLRITFSAAHGEDQVNRLLDALAEIKQHSVAE